MNKKGFFTFVWIMLLLLAGGCTSDQPAMEESSPTKSELPAQEEPTLAEPTEIPPTEEPTAAPPTEIPQPTAEVGFEALPAEEQEITFYASDGQELTGIYYPAAVNPAPVIVLMHWVRGNQKDWVEIAYWLQNRGLGGSTGATSPWLDPSWFPVLPEATSYAVFTFSFRNCESSCMSFTPDLWLLDAQAAMETAMNLDGIDAERILSAGASIGADGAADGCLWLNQTYGAHCRGAFSFSPGNYLTQAYPDVVAGLETLELPVPASCLFSTGDRESAQTCAAASGALYETQEWEGALHGMMLIQPGLEPDVLESFIQFIQDNL